MSEGRLPKPQLRNLHLARVKRNLIYMTLTVAAVGLSFKLFVCDVYERKVENFYKTYDPMKALKIMNDAGLMQSCPKE